MLRTSVMARHGISAWATRNASSNLRAASCVIDHRNARPQRRRGADFQSNAAYFLHNLRILRKLWGGPPGPRGPPWTRFSPMKSASYTRQQADGGVVPRGDPGTRGSAPQSMQTVQYWEKYAALDSESAPRRLGGEWTSATTVRPAARDSLPE